MTPQITEYDRPVRFVDEQMRGPFRTFRNTHTFIQHDNDTTEIIDEVEFCGVEQGGARPVVMRSKQYVAAIRAHGDHLVMSTLVCANELVERQRREEPDPQVCDPQIGVEPGWGDPR